jgi:hypothetical protein
MCEMSFLSYHQFTVLIVSHMVNSNFQLGFSKHANKKEVRRFYISLPLCYALSPRKYPTVV